jgi:dCMP deaminase
VGTGYNGTARGVVNCYNVGCIKDILNAPSGKSYDYCPAVHAEENAIINSNRADRIGATLFVAGINDEGELTVALPCKRCRRKIINSQIEKVIILDKDGTPLTFKVNDYIKEDTNWYIGELKTKRSGDSQ